MEIFGGWTIFKNVVLSRSAETVGISVRHNKCRRLDD